jgi:hypothetical protein
MLAQLRFSAQIASWTFMVAKSQIPKFLSFFALILLTISTLGSFTQAKILVQGDFERGSLTTLTSPNSTPTPTPQPTSTIEPTPTSIQNQPQTQQLIEALIIGTIIASIVILTTLVLMLEKRKQILSSRPK